MGGGLSVLVEMVHIHMNEHKNRYSIKTRETHKIDIYTIIIRNICLKND